MGATFEKIVNTQLTGKTCEIAYYSGQPAPTRTEEVSWNGIDLQRYKINAVYLRFTAKSQAYSIQYHRFVNDKRQWVDTITRQGITIDSVVNIELNSSVYTDSSGQLASVKMAYTLSRNSTSKAIYYDVNLVFILEELVTDVPSTVVVFNADAGQPQTVSLTNTSDTVYHDVRWLYGEAGTILDSDFQTFAASTRAPAWAIPSEGMALLYARNPNTSVVTGKVTVKTYSRFGTLLEPVGVYNAPLTIPQNDDTRPTLSVNITVAKDAPVIENVYLQGKTRLTVTPTAQVNASASIASIRITTPDGEYTVANNESKQILVQTAGNYPVTVTVTDTRGFQRSLTETYEIQTFTGVRISDASVTRCDANGVETDEGTYLHIVASALIDAVLSDGADATWQASLRQKNSGISTTITLPSGKDINTIQNASLSAEKSYEITLTVSAGGVSSSQTLEIGVAIYTIHRMAGGNGVAFGKPSELYGVEVRRDWPLYTHGQEILKLTVDAAHPVGSVIQTLDGTFDPNEKWPWTQWGKLNDCVLVGSGTQAILTTGTITTTTNPTIPSLAVNTWVRSR